MNRIILVLAALILFGSGGVAFADKTPQIVFSGNSFGYINPCPT
jgi:hypothetical protein